MNAIQKSLVALLAVDLDFRSHAPANDVRRVRERPHPRSRYAARARGARAVARSFAVPCLVLASVGCVVPAPWTLQLEPSNDNGVCRPGASGSGSGCGELEAGGSPESEVRAPPSGASNGSASCPAGQCNAPLDP
jgi:hypothetical protein